MLPVAAGERAQLVARNVGALAAMRAALPLAARRHRALPPERLPAQGDAAGASMRFFERAPVAQEPAAGLHRQQRVDRKLRALIIDPQRHPLGGKVNDAVTRIGFSLRKVLDKPIQPVSAL